MKMIKLFVWFLGLVLLSSCSTTQITSAWKAPDATAKKYNKLMVVGIIREVDRNLREQMENHLVDDLKALGYNAFSAYKEYGPKTFQDMTEQQVTDKLSKEGVDAVMTVVFLDKKQERYYVPGRVVYSPYIIYHNRFYGYYRSVYNRIETAGYYEVSTKYFWESNLYDLADHKLIYSVQTESFEPASVDALAHEYGKKIIENMIKSNVLSKQGEAVVKAM